MGVLVREGLDMSEGRFSTKITALVGRSNRSMTLFLFNEGAQRMRPYHAAPSVDIDITSFTKPGGFPPVNMMSHLVNIYIICVMYGIFEMGSYQLNIQNY
jgi:hypothetical protein